MIKYISGGLLGGLFGYFILYRVIGCATGSCAITANPITATIYGIVIGLVIASLFAPTVKKDQAAYVRISPEEALVKMQDDDQSIILDVRSRAEYDAGHLPGALLLPVFSIRKNAPGLLDDQKARILVYCQTGARSAHAAKKLLKLGYEHVFDFGGIKGWPGELVRTGE